MFRFKLMLPAFLSLAVSSFALERELTFNFTGAEIGKVPEGFRPALTGKGKPGQWQIISVDAPSAFPSVTGKAPTTARQQVLAQLSRDPTDERFPLLIYEGEAFSDFTLTVQVRMVGGAIEQMAGVAFRVQDENNYYVVRANALNGNFRFYKFVNGERSNPIGPEIPIALNEWHEITIECKGNQFRLLLNGKEAMPPLVDTSFSSGKVGFWTKSDSESQFANARIKFVPKDKLVVTLVNDAMKKFDRLRELRVYSYTANNPEVRVLASNLAEDVGKPANESQRECLKTGKPFHAKSKSGKTVTVLVPLKDRNGDNAAVLEVTMDSFFGQTEGNALQRAMTVAQSMQSKILSREDLVE